MNEPAQSSETQQILEDLRSKGREVAQLTEQLSHEQKFQAGLLAEMADLENQCTALEKENEVLRGLRNHPQPTSSDASRKLQGHVEDLKAELQNKDQKVVTARETLGKLVNAMGCSLSESGAFVSPEDELRTTVDSKKSFEFANATASMTAWGTMEMKALAEARYLHEEGQKVGLAASTTLSSMARSIRDLRDQGSVLGQQRDLLKAEVRCCQGAKKTEHPLMAEERALLEEVESMQNELAGVQEEQRQAEAESKALQEENVELQKEKAKLVQLMAHQDVDWEAEANLRHANLEKARLAAAYDKELQQLQEKLAATAVDNQALQERLAALSVKNDQNVPPHAAQSCSSPHLLMLSSSQPCLTVTSSGVSSPSSPSVPPTLIGSLRSTGAMPQPFTAFVRSDRSFSPARRSFGKSPDGASPPPYCPLLGTTLLGTSSAGSIPISPQKNVGEVTQSMQGLFLSGGSSASASGGSPRRQGRSSVTQRPLLSGPGGGAPRPPVTVPAAAAAPPQPASKFTALRQGRSMTPKRSTTPQKLRASTPPRTPTRALTPPSQIHGHLLSPNSRALRGSFGASAGTPERSATMTPSPAAYRQAPPQQQQQQQQHLRQQQSTSHVAAMTAVAGVAAVEKLSTLQQSQQSQQQLQQQQLQKTQQQQWFQMTTTPQRLARNLA